MPWNHLSWNPVPFFPLSAPHKGTVLATPKTVGDWQNGETFGRAIGLMAHQMLQSDLYGGEYDAVIPRSLMMYVPDTFSLVQALELSISNAIHLPWRLQDIDQAVDKLVAGRPYPLVRTEVEAQLAKMYPVPAPVHEDRGFILLDQDDMIAALHIPGAISPALLATAHAAFEDLAGAGLLKDGDDCHPCGTGLLTVGFGNSPTIDCSQPLTDHQIDVLVRFAKATAPIYALNTAVQYMLAEQQVDENYLTRRRFVRDCRWWKQERLETADPRRYEFLEHWTTTFPALHIGANIPIGWERTVTGMPSYLRPITGFGESGSTRILSLPTAGISCTFSPGSVTLVRSYGLPFTLSSSAGNQVYTMEDGPSDLHYKYGGARFGVGGSEFVDPLPADFKTVMYKFDPLQETRTFYSLGFLTDAEMTMLSHRPGPMVSWHK